MNRKAGTDAVTPGSTSEVRRRKIKRVVLWSLLAVAGAVGVGAAKLFAHINSLPVRFGLSASSASEGSRWPWKSAPQVLGPGVAAWETTTSDGTILRLMRFDRSQNARLKFSIYAAGAEDGLANDNLVAYWNHGAAQATQRLNARWKASGEARQVLAASNGAFFGYANKVLGPEARAFHVGPLVLDGKIFFNGKNHRWTFGTTKGGRFDVVHLPSREGLKRFDYAAGSVQCLVRDGVPLLMQPFPRGRRDFLPQPVPSTASEAGHVPYFDHMRTSRVSLAWSRDSKIVWWLIVKEPDFEPGSDLFLQYGVPIGGGWTVPDVQRFWLSLRQSEGDRVWCAINSDAGDVGQMAWRSGVNYEMIPARWADKRMKIRLKRDFSNAPGGGGIMAFVMSG